MSASQPGLSDASELLDAVEQEAALDEPAPDAGDGDGEWIGGDPNRDDDSRDTAEVEVNPALSQLLLEEEKTQPRIRLPAGIFGSPSGQVSDWDRPNLDERSRPQPEPEQPSVVVMRPAVIIAPARIISDRPPASEGLPPVRMPQQAPPPSEALQRPVAEAPRPAPRIPRSPPPPPPPPELLQEPRRVPALETPDFEDLREPQPPTPEPTRTAAPEVPQPAPEAAPAQAAPSTLSEPPIEDSGLQLFEVDVADEPEAQQKARTPPPPPPPDARAKPAPPKRPPPPPAAAPPPPQVKVEDDKQKRKQVRQWWERFFSDDYLMSVLPPTPAQIAKQVDFIEQSLGIAKGGTILDLGCGLGFHAVELSRRGYLVVGLDLSLAMITRAAEYAQEQQVKLNVVHADIREMEFDGAFDAVICMGTTFGFFDDDSNRDMLARLFQALRPGGRVLLDTVNRDYVIRFQPNLVWFEGDECVCMEESDFNYFNARLTVKRTLMREDGRQSQSEYSVRLYSLHELGQLMQQAGFRVIEVSGQEAIRGTFFGAHSPRVLLLAERRLPARASTVLSGERGGMDLNRPSVAFPPERGSAELPKGPKPE